MLNIKNVKAKYKEKKRGKRPQRETTADICIQKVMLRILHPSCVASRSLLAAYAGFWRSHLSACARSNAFMSHFYPTAQKLVAVLALPSTAQAAVLQHHGHCCHWVMTDIRMQAASTAQSHPCISSNQFPS